MQASQFISVRAIRNSHPPFSLYKSFSFNNILDSTPPTRQNDHDRSMLQGVPSEISALALGHCKLGGALQACAGDRSERSTFEPLSVRTSEIQHR